MLVTYRTTARVEGYILKTLRSEQGILHEYWINGFGSKNNTDTIWIMEERALRKAAREDESSGF